MHQEILRYIRPLLPHPFDLAVILGSGLGSFASCIEEAVCIETGAVPGYPQSTVSGHRGRIIGGRLHGKKILLFDGRVHGYEGYGWDQVTLPVDLAWAMGARGLLLTNAAGGLQPRFRPGDLMLITDYLISPLASRKLLMHVRPSSSGFRPAFDGESLRIVRDAAAACAVPLREGTYCFVSGPSYETRAEIAVLRKMGGDAVGMSTIPEVIASHQYGLKTIALSCITNTATVLPKKITHAEVTLAAGSATASFTRLLSAVIAAYPAG